MKKRNDRKDFEDDLAFMRAMLYRRKAYRDAMAYQAFVILSAEFVKKWDKRITLKKKNK